MFDKGEEIFVVAEFGELIDSVIMLDQARKESSEPFSISVLYIGHSGVFKQTYKGIVNRI